MTTRHGVCYQLSRLIDYDEWSQDFKANRIHSLCVKRIRRKTCLAYTSNHRCSGLILLPKNGSYPLSFAICSTWTIIFIQITKIFLFNYNFWSQEWLILTHFYYVSEGKVTQVTKLTILYDCCVYFVLIGHNCSKYGCYVFPGISSHLNHRFLHYVGIHFLLRSSLFCFGSDLVLIG